MNNKTLNEIGNLISDGECFIKGSDNKDQIINDTNIKIYEELCKNDIKEEDRKRIIEDSDRCLRLVRCN